MKRIFAILLFISICMTAFLAGCDEFTNNSRPVNDTENQDSSSEQNEENPSTAEESYAETSRSDAEKAESCEIKLYIYGKEIPLNYTVYRGEEIYATNYITGVNTQDAYFKIGSEYVKSIKVNSSRSLWIVFCEEIVLYNGDVIYDVIKGEYGVKKELPVLSLSGYVFDGWYDSNGQKIKEAVFGETERRLYVKFGLTKYTITYDLGIAEKSNNPNQYVSSDSITLKVPEYDDDSFIFCGWYEDSDFTKKVTSIKNTSGNKKLYASFIKKMSDKLCVRSSAVTITDSGRANQAYDVIYVKDYLGKEPKELAEMGIKYIDVCLSLDVSEVNDGYQYVFLYNTTTVKSRSNDNIISSYVNIFVDAMSSAIHNALGESEARKEDEGLVSSVWKFEHSPGKKDTSWGAYGATFRVPVARLDEAIYIRYGASGNFEDTWKNQNVSAYISIVG